MKNIRFTLALESFGLNDCGQAVIDPPGGEAPPERGAFLRL